MKRASDLHKNTYITAGALSIAGCFLMICFPDLSINGVRRGMELFFESILPTLFPFMILVNFMGALGFPERIGRIFEPLFRRLFFTSGTGAFIWICGMFSGYPMAAKLVGDFTRDGRISPEEGKRILSFSCVAGPLFMIGTVGTAMLGDPKEGYVIALGHYLAALINGLIFCRWILPHSAATAFGGDRGAGNMVRPAVSGSLFGILSEAIANALRTMGSILGYVVLFSMITMMIRGFGWIGGLERPVIGALFQGCLEMTIGCSAVSELSDVRGPLRLGLCSLILGFGGCSVTGQSLSVLSGSGIDSRYFVGMKMSHGLISGFITAGITSLAGTMGLFDIPTGIVYGTQSPGILLFGRVHTLIYTSKSMVVVVGLMIGLILIDGMVRREYRKIHTYIIERRKRNV